MGVQSTSFWHRRGGTRRLRLQSGLVGAVVFAAVAGSAIAGGAGGAAAPPAPNGPPPTECRWTDGPITLDGWADEPGWRSAAVVDRFGAPWLGKAAATATRARLLWDREYLYFSAEMQDQDLMTEKAGHDGRLWEGDVFEIFLKPASDRPGYYEFHANPDGDVLDMLIPSRGTGGYDRYRADGDFHVEAKVLLDGTLNRPGDRDRRWLVEGRIPWTDFLRTGGRPNPGESWRYALCRYDYTAGLPRPQTSTSAPLTRPDFHRYEDYSELRFLGPQAPPGTPDALRSRTPLTTSRVVGSPDPPHPYRARRRYPRLKLSYPVAAAREPDRESMLAILQDSPGGPSQLVRFRDEEGADAAESLLRVDRIAYDLVFHPDFARNGYLYLSSRGPLSAPGSEQKLRISRFTVDRRPPHALVPGSESVVIEWLSNGHDGGAMAFGKDGMFYVTSGDGTTDSDTNVVGQELGTLLAKVLRIDIDHPDAGLGYSVPRDNPFVNTPGARPETWAYGFRNPWRMTVDRETGHVWVGMNGQDLWEPAYLVKRGANYGWSVFEGSHPFYPGRKLGPTPVSPPTVEHPHSEARSLTGGVVYYGARHPDLRGEYVYGDYSTGKIWAAKHDGTRLLSLREIADTTLQITGFAVDSQGEILIADMRGGDEGAFYTLDRTPPQREPSRFPRLLSETGLFRSVRGHLVQPSLVPYTVNAPLWSDGAHKERFLGLPGADGRMEVTANRGWNLPNGAVIVKSFALEARPGAVGSRRWVETRLLTRQDGEWVGYSYAWNREQTEAELVEAGGRDAEVELGSGGRMRKQAWRYPSRAECMVCHTRAANYVLGITTLQLNRDNSEGRPRENQLRMFERLGMLQTGWQSEAEEALRRQARAQALSGDQIEAYVQRHAPATGQRAVPVGTLFAAPPAGLPRLADPANPREKLELRARSYIHANCSHCHVEAGGGNAQMELEFTTPLDRMRVVGVKPVHETFGMKDARLIAPGDPDNSVLLHRTGMRDKGHMPPLASRLVDQDAVRLIRGWIGSMK